MVIHRPDSYSWFSIAHAIAALRNLASFVCLRYVDDVCISVHGNFCMVWGGGGECVL